MKSKHIFLNLFVMDFPLTAIMSILHRISGIILFFFIPVFLYFLKLSIESNSSFEIAQIIFSKIYIKFFLYCIYLIFLYHLINGLKHIIIDLGFFDNKKSSKFISYISILLILSVYFLSIIV